MVPKGEMEETGKFREVVSETFRSGAPTNIEDFLPILGCIGLKGSEKRLMELYKRRESFIQNLIEEHKSKGSQCCKRQNNL